MFRSTGCCWRPSTTAAIAPDVAGPANIDKFLAQARDAAGKMSLDEFVAELAMVREENPREPDAPPEDSADAVKVMTVHSAKGLEFPIVFVAALQKGVGSDPPVVAFSGNRVGRALAESRRHGQERRPVPARAYAPSGSNGRITRATGCFMWR